MTGRERVLCALRREEPDCVPTFEWIIDRGVCRALCGSEDLLDAADALDLDGVVVRCDYEKRRIDSENYVDEWGSRKHITAESLDVVTESPIRNIRNHKNLRFPNPRAPHRFASLERALQRFGDLKAVILSVRDVFSDIRDLVGYENALIAMIADRQAYGDLLDRIIEYNLELARTARDRFGVQIVATTDDITDTRGLIMGPDLYFSLLAPRFREVIKGFKELGYYCIKHCDGNVNELLEFWIECGIDCIDPIDPNGGMDIEQVKHVYGGRVCIKGNVNCETTLVSGTEEEVIREVRDCLRKAAHGGGHILSSSNSIHSGVKPENYRAMLEALRRYGTYPLKL
jgi:uroporphyrinogen decarboxylase